MKKKVGKKAPPKKATVDRPFGVPYLAKKLDISEAVVTKRLRELDTPRTGRSYAWSQSEVDKLAKKLAA